MIGWALRQVLVLGALALAVYAIASYGLAERERVPAPDLAASAPESARPRSAAMPNSLVFHANRQGHVVLDGAVNGATVRFLVDTGSTYVALSRQDAAAAGLGDGDLDFRVAFNTANGRALAAPVRLREIRIGQFAADDVPAVVMNNLAISLLGQSFLARLESYEMHNGVLTLNWN